MMSLPEQKPFKMQLLSGSRLGLMELLTGSRLGLTVPLRSNSQLDSTKPLITVLNKQ